MITFDWVCTREMMNGVLFVLSALYSPHYYSLSDCVRDVPTEVFITRVSCWGHNFRSIQAYFIIFWRVIGKCKICD